MRRGTRIAIPWALVAMVAGVVAVSLSELRVTSLSAPSASTTTVFHAPTTSAPVRTAPSTTTTVAPSTTTTTTAPRLVLPDYHALPDWSIWRQLGRCEEPEGGAPDGIAWNHEGGAYVSGFGMARTTYDWGARLAGLPAWHIDTPPLIQILVARSAKAHGADWGCEVRVVGW